MRIKSVAPSNRMTSHEHRKRAMGKFESDLEAALSAEPQLKVFVFFTNVNLTISERTELEDCARRRGIEHCEIFYRERIRIVLDSPDGFSIRFQYLGIPLSEAEQATFFAKWGDDIQNVISEGFGKIERTLNRLHFLAEAVLPLSHFTIILELDREYSASEIGHFRAFCSLDLVEPRDRVVGLLFGSTDDPKRVNAKEVNELNLAEGGVARGICGRQWKEMLRDDADMPDPFTKTHEFLAAAGSFGAVGMRTVQIRIVGLSQEAHGPERRLRTTKHCIDVPLSIGSSTWMPWFNLRESLVNC
jgi:hypothetical protein